MKKRIFKRTFSAFLVLALMLPSLPAFAAGGGTGEALYEHTQEITDGFYYTNAISKNSSGKRMETFCLESGAGSGVYPIVLAKDVLYSTMDINDMVAWAKTQGLNVHGAINADFFYSSRNLPLGGFIRDGEYVSGMNNENLLAFTDNGVIFSPKPEVAINLENHGGTPVTDPVTGVVTYSPAGTVTVYNINEMRDITGGMYIYTSSYHNVSTNTNRPGWGVRFKITQGEKLTVSCTMELTVEEIIPNGTDYPIGEGYIVLSAPADNPQYADYYKKFTVGDTVTLTTVCSDERLAGARWAAGCGDLLVENGKMTDPAGWDKAINKEAHPRTAFGVKPDGSVVAYVVDGRRGSYSNGAMLEEVAADLVDMGCDMAVNFDGGGSTAMSVRIPGTDTCAVVNRPSDGKPRKVSSYILFVSDIQPDGVPARLHLENDGAMVYAGSTLPLSFIATDQSGLPAELPGKVTASGTLGNVEDIVIPASTDDAADDESSGNTDGENPDENTGEAADETAGETVETGGEVTQTVYLAGGTTGWDALEIEAGGVTGIGNIFITDKLDTLTITDAETGLAPSFTDIDADFIGRLNAAGTYLGRDVALDNESVIWSITDGLGEITTDGLFILKGAPGSQGEITAKAGGRTVTIPVSIKKGLLDISGHWAESYITELYSMGIVTGTGDNLFRPDDTIGRCDFVLMLWRALGSPVTEPEEGQERALCTFTDVPLDAYYYDAVVWAERIELSNGIGGGLFDPRGPLTREQAFTLVHRLLTVMRRELPEPDSEALLVFSDYSEISSYAYDAMASLTASGMIAGSDGKCFPLRQITRAEMAKILYTALY